MAVAQDRLIALAVQGVPASRSMLDAALRGVDPDALGFSGWRALQRMADRLEPGSVWAARVAGLRRRNHAAAAVGARAAVRVASALQDAGIACAAFGDLALAVAYGQAPGEQSIGTVRLWADPACASAEVVRVVGAGSDASWSERGVELTTTVDGIGVTVQRGWSHLLASPVARQRTPARRDVLTVAGTLPVVAAEVELHRQLVMRGQPYFDGWLLDVATVATADPDVWPRTAALAHANARTATVLASWVVAHEAGLAPPPPRLPRDRLVERARQVRNRRR